MLDNRSVFTPDIQCAETKTRRIQNYAVTQNSGVNFWVTSTLTKPCEGSPLSTLRRFWVTKNLQRFRNGGKVRGNFVPLCTMSTYGALLILVTTWLLKDRFTHSMPFPCHGVPLRV